MLTALDIPWPAIAKVPRDIRLFTSHNCTPTKLNHRSQISNPTEPPHHIPNQHPSSRIARNEIVCPQTSPFNYLHTDISRITTGMVVIVSIIAVFSVVVGSFYIRGRLELREQRAQQGN
jgi:hypothetical protein